MSQHLALVAALLTGIATFPLHAAEAGRIKSVSGTAYIERAGDRTTANVGTPVYQADTLVTGADGSVGITFIDNSRMSAGPNSTLVINRYAFDQTTHAGAFDATLARGTLAAVSGRLARHSPAAVTVSTPTLVLGVRGTEFLVFAE